MSFIVAIEGNIAAGKSTILNEIAKKGYPVFPEPFEANPYLPLYYRDPSRYAFHVQIWFLSARRKQFLAAANQDADLVFVERTVYSDRWAFATLLHEQGHLTDLDWRAYLMHFETCKTHKPDLAITLSVKAEECLRRVKSRAREMEATVPLDYLKDLDEVYSRNLHNLGIISRKHYYPSSLPVDVVAQSLVNEAKHEMFLQGLAAEDVRSVPASSDLVGLAEAMAL